MSDQSRSEAARFLRDLARIGAMAGALWVVFYVLHLVLPGIRAGADQVYETKLDLIATGELFDPGAEARVIIFGNSRVLAGFVSEIFDRALEGGVSSFNAGIPDASHFVDELEQLVDRGEAPTHVLLVNCWSVAPEPTLRQRLGDDERIIETLFPFRRLARNSSLFLLRSRARGGVRAYYADVEARLDRLIEDRGYHFIESQSHYPGNRLPEDFRTDLDDPARSRPRPTTVVGSRKPSCAPQGPVFERLVRIKQREGLSVALVPGYFRLPEVAPPPPNDELRGLLAPYGIAVLGPDYYRLPHRLFADAVHLNREGAEIYTQRLAALFRSAEGRDAL